MKETEEVKSIGKVNFLDVLMIIFKSIVAFTLIFIFCAFIYYIFH